MTKDEHMQALIYAPLELHNIKLARSESRLLGWRQLAVQQQPHNSRVLLCCYLA